MAHFQIVPEGIENVNRQIMKDHRGNRDADVANVLYGGGLGFSSESISSLGSLEEAEDVATAWKANYYVTKFGKELSVLSKPSRLIVAISNLNFRIRSFITTFSHPTSKPSNGYVDTIFTVSSLGIGIIRTTIHLLSVVPISRASQCTLPHARSCFCRRVQNYVRKRCTLQSSRATSWCPASWLSVPLILSHLGVCLMRSIDTFFPQPIAN